MAKKFPSVHAFMTDDSGSTAIEYALIASIVSISIAAAVTLLRNELQSSYQGVANGLKSANN